MSFNQVILDSITNDVCFCTNEIML